jgi:hypothetical protein
VARSLAKRRTHARLSCPTRDPFFTEVVRGAEDAAQPRLHVADREQRND